MHSQVAQQALGHNSKAVHHAYSKHAEVTVPSLDDWEKQWKENPQGIVKLAVVQMDFRSDKIDACSGASEASRRVPKMPGCLPLQPVTVLDKRLVKLPSGALETRLLDRA